MLHRKNLVIFILPILLLLGMLLFDSAFLSESKRTLLQILFYPAVLIALAQLNSFGMRLPKNILGLSGVFAVLAVGYAYMYPLKAKRGGLVIARLEGDELQNETRIFREKINRALEDQKTIRALSINQSFKNIEEARQFITENDSVKILVSGDRRWINILFPEKPAQALSELGLRIGLQTAESLKLHYTVGSIGLSLHPSKETALFIANLAEGLINSKDRFKSDDYELSLLAAGKVEAFWSSANHRGYPYWFLANKHMELALHDLRNGRSHLDCALNLYIKAFSLTRRGDNPDLRASILSNLGTAHAVRGYRRGKKRDFNRAKKYYAWALAIYKENSKLPRNYSAAETALHNLAIVSESKRNFTKSERNKKKSERKRLKKEKRREKKQGRSGKGKRNGRGKNIRAAKKRAASN